MPIFRHSSDVCLISNSRRFWFDYKSFSILRFFSSLSSSAAEWNHSGLALCRRSSVVVVVGIYPRRSSRSVQALVWSTSDMSIIRTYDEKDEQDAARFSSLRDTAASQPAAAKWNSSKKFENRKFSLSLSTVLWDLIKIDIWWEKFLLAACTQCNRGSIPEKPGRPPQNWSTDQSLSEVTHPYYRCRFPCKRTDIALHSS